MAETTKFFQCPVCRHAAKYEEAGHALFQGMQVQLYACKSCSTVFTDPKKFGFVRSSHNILSQDEIDALLRAIGSGNISHEQANEEEEPLVRFGRMALSDLFDELYKEIMEGEDERADFSLDKLGRIIRERKEAGRGLTDSQKAFLSLYEESTSHV